MGGFEFTTSPLTLLKFYGMRQPGIEPGTKSHSFEICAIVRIWSKNILCKLKFLIEKFEFRTFSHPMVFNIILYEQMCQKILRFDSQRNFLVDD